MRVCILKQLLLIFVLCSISAFAQTDIEKNFSTSNNIDLTGTYPVSGYLEDSSQYNAILKLQKWNTFTTPMGNVLQSFKMDYQYGDIQYAGIAVFDGHRLYYAMGDKNGSQNYYLLLLSKLELPTQASISLYELANAKAQKKEGHFVDWEGDPPWYGYIGTEAKGYGYWFWIDGIWGQYATRKSEFPHLADSGAYFMLELKKNGKFGKKQPYTFPEGVWNSGLFQTKPDGENHQVAVASQGKALGTGMLVQDPITGDTILVAMMGGPSNSTVAYMDIVGNKIVGVWAAGSGGYRRSEEWNVPEDVIKKNPGLFR